MFRFHHNISSEGEEVFNRQLDQIPMWRTEGVQQKKSVGGKYVRTRVLTFSKENLCQMFFTQPSMISDSHQIGQWLLVSMATVSECEKLSKNDCSHFASKALMQSVT